VGDEDQLLAIEDALAQFGADAIVVVGHVPGQDNWHERRVIERAREKLGVPVYAVPITAEGEVI
jgi:heptaprenylglyceryl phosphate synthase